MPQLDFISFFSQIFWFLLFFFIFYFIFLNKLVFFFGSCLKIRKKKLVQSDQRAIIFVKESQSFGADYNELLMTSIKISIVSFSKAFSILDLDLKGQESSQLNLKKTNIRFLTIFGSFVALHNFLPKYFLVKLIEESGRVVNCA